MPLAERSLLDFDVVVLEEVEQFWSREVDVVFVAVAQDSAVPVTRGVHLSVLWCEDRIPEIAAL